MTQTAGPLGRGRFLAWTGIVLLVLYLVIAGGGGTGGTLVPQFRLASLLLTAIVVGTWTIVAWTRPERRPATTLWPAVIAVLAAYLAATLGSWNLRLSLEFLGYAVLLVALYLFVVQVLRDPALRPRMLSLTALLCGAIAVIYIWISVRYWIDWWGAVGHLTTPPLRPGFEGLTYGNPSGVAAIVLLLALTATAWLAGMGRPGLVAMTILVGLTAVVVVISGTRGAWLAVGLATGVTVALALARPAQRATIREGIRRLPKAGLLAVVGAVAVAAVTVGPAILQRLVGGGGDSLRVTLNLTALRMFAEDPLTGSGPGTWVVRRAAFTEPQEVDYYIPHAHNVFTQGLAEFGLAGVLAALVVIFFVGRLILRALLGENAEQRRVAWATVFGLTYFAGHQLVDFQMNVPAVMFAAVLPIAYLDASAVEATSQPTPTKRLRELRSIAESRAVLVIVALACAVVIAGLARIEIPAMASLAASAAANDHDPAGSSRLAREALAGDPDHPAYWFQTGLAIAAEDPDAALALMRRSAETDDFPQAWLNVAAMELARGSDAEARDAVARAMRIGWQQPAVAFAAGWLDVQLGDQEDAVAAFAIALQFAPELADDPFWDSSPELAAARDAAVDRAMTDGSPTTALLIAMFNGEPDEARARSQQLPEPQRTLYSLVVNAWNDDTAAQTRLIEIAEANPLDTTAAVWSAFLAARDGDTAARDQFRVWAGLVGGSLGTAIGQDTVVTDAPWNRRQVAGPNANFQGIYTYRRLYPWDLLVPGLPKLTLE